MHESEVVLIERARVDKLFALDVSLFDQPLRDSLIFVDVKRMELGQHRQPRHSRQAVTVRIQDGDRGSRFSPAPRPSRAHTFLTSSVSLLGEGLGDALTRVEWVSEHPFD